MRLIGAPAEDVVASPDDGELLDCVPGIINGGATLLAVSHLTEDAGQALDAVISVPCVIVAHDVIADETGPLLEQECVGLKVELL